jgi:hypothetical protein
VEAKDEKSVLNFTLMNIGDMIAFSLFLVVVIAGFLLSFYLLRDKR